VERIELESEEEEADMTNNTTASNTKMGEPVSHDKIHVTPVLEWTEELLKSAFTPMENKDRRQLQHQFIVPDTPFTTPPHLDKMIAGECSKSTRATDNLFQTFRRTSWMPWDPSQGS